METKKDSGILFSRVLVWVFGLLILILDWAVWPISRWLMLFIVDMQYHDTVLLIICLYMCNVPGFVLLWCMDKLLRNLRQGKVFEDDNGTFEKYQHLLLRDQHYQPESLHQNLLFGHCGTDDCVYGFDRADR